MNPSAQAQKLYDELVSVGFCRAAEALMTEAQGLGFAIRPTTTTASTAPRATEQLSTKNIAPGPDGRFHCPVTGCTESYTLKTNLRRHLNDHAVIKPHVCRVCKASYSRSDDLTSHIRSQHGTVAKSTAAAAAAVYSFPVSVTSPSNSDAAETTTADGAVQRRLGKSKRGAEDGAALDEGDFADSVSSSFSAATATQSDAAHTHGAHCGHLPLIFEDHVLFLLSDGTLSTGGTSFALPESNTHPACCTPAGLHTCASPHHPSATALVSSSTLHQEQQQQQHAPSLSTGEPSLSFSALGAEITAGDDRLKLPGLDGGTAHVASATWHDHTHVHQEGCGHALIRHGNHFDYLVGRTLHHQHILHQPRPRPSQATLPSSSHSHSSCSLPASSRSSVHSEARDDSSSEMSVVALSGEVRGGTAASASASASAPDGYTDAGCEHGHAHVVSGMHPDTWLHCDWHGELEPLAADDLHALSGLEDLLGSSSGNTSGSRSL